MKSLSIEKEYLYATIAAILYGTITVGGQFFINLGLSVFEISIYRSLIVSLVLFPLLLVNRNLLIKKDMLLFFTIYGLIGGLLILAQFGGIALGVPVAIVVLLLYTQPIWTIVFGKLLLNEEITPTKMIAALIAILGVLLLLKSWDIKSTSSFTGIIVSLIGGILLSLWVIWGRKSTIKKQHFITTTFGWTGFSAIWLLLLWAIVTSLVTQNSLIRLTIHFQTEYWLYLLIYALVGGVIPHLFFFRGFQRIHASVAGIILLLEPVSASILAAIFFAQPLGIEIIIGGALILLSNYFVIREANQTIEPF